VDHAGGQRGKGGPAEQSFGLDDGSMIAVLAARYLGLEYLANKLLVCYILIERYGEVVSMKTAATLTGWSNGLGRKLIFRRGGRLGRRRPRPIIQLA
jgi:hypothetical protein